MAKVQQTNQRQQARNAPAVQQTPKAPAKVTNEQMPDFMQGMSGEGTEMLGSGDVAIPRIKLIQAISPEITEFEGIKAGDFFHTVIERAIGTSPKIVPIYTDKRAMLWQPLHQGGGILARSDDCINWVPGTGKFDVQPVRNGPKVTWELKPTVAESRLLEWGTSIPTDNSSPPAATLMYNMVVAFPEMPDLGFAVVTLQRSGIKVARNFLGKVKISKAPSFGQVYVMSNITEQGPEGPYYNYRFTAAGFVTDNDMFQSYRDTYEVFRKEGLRIRDIEGLQDDQSQDAARPGSGPSDSNKY